MSAAKPAMPDTKMTKAPVPEVTVSAASYTPVAEIVAPVQSQAHSPFQWLWANDHGSYTPYPTSVSCTLTQSYYDDPSGSTVLDFNNRTYWVDFKSMKQINVDTGFERKLKLTFQSDSTSQQSMLSKNIEDETTSVPLTYENEACSLEQHEPDADDEEEDNTHCIYLYGPEINLEPAKNWIQEQLDSIIKTYSLSLPARLSQKLEEKLQKIASKYHIEIQISDSPQDRRKKTLEIRGVGFKVDKAITEMKQAISNHGSSSSLSDSLPPWWQPQSATVQVFAVRRGTPEFKHIEFKFFSTMTRKYIIKRIERVQNQWLWKKYIQQRSMMDEKNSGVVNEMELFHGTGSTDPRAIYDSEEGFDMRFSAQGMWGQANYFAVNANYSHSYSHTDSSGQMTMFLAKVLTGDNFYCSSDRSLRMPPLKSSAGGVQLGQVRYDTVTGVTGGSAVYMTYDNQKAYPAYLITYSSKYRNQYLD